MAFLLFIIIASLLVIAFAEPLGERIGVVAPIILLVVGAATAFLPQVPDITINPEIILQLILPPLLFSTAMRMPAHDFRRNLGAIFALAVVLVVATALCVGVVINLLVPQIPLAVAVAVGAVVSPSDAVAVGIVKRAGVSRRIVAILDGEGLVNDASALVVLGTALLAATQQVSAPAVVGQFVWAVAGAVIVGYAVGRLFMFLRRYVHQPTSNTVLSLAIPFAAYLPAEEIGSSGLVATVAAGLVVAAAAPRVLSPATRFSDTQTWDTMGLVLESLVFVMMGLQLPALIDAAQTSGFTFLATAVVALSVWATVLVLRTLTMMPLAWTIRRGAGQMHSRAQRLGALGQRLDEFAQDPRITSSPRASRRVQSGRARVARGEADSAYFAAKPLGLRAGAVMVWAGMRGAVTLAAAQTLPADTPGRSFLILVSFAVAAFSLVVQGGTLSWVVDALKPGTDVPSSPEERRRVRAVLSSAAADVEVPSDLADALTVGGLPRERAPQATLLELARAARDAGVVHQLTDYAVARVIAQREALLNERDAGRIDAPDFDSQLRRLDVEQLAIEAQAREYAERQGA